MAVGIASSKGDLSGVSRRGEFVLISTEGGRRKTPWFRSPFQNSPSLMAPDLKLMELGFTPTLGLLKIHEFKGKGVLCHLGVRLETFLGRRGDSQERGNGLG